MTLVNGAVLYVLYSLLHPAVPVGAQGRGLVQRTQSPCGWWAALQLGTCGLLWGVLALLLAAGRRGRSAFVRGTGLSLLPRPCGQAWPHPPGPGGGEKD